VLNEQDDKDFEEHNRTVEMHEKAQQSAERQLANLTRMRMLEQLEDEEYDRERTRLKNEITILKAKESQIDMHRESWLELTKKAFVFASNASRAFTGGNAEVKRSILTAMGLNWTLLDHKLNIEAPEWLIPFASLQPQADTPIMELEPADNIETKRQKEAFASSRPVLRDRPDLNRQPLACTYPLFS
jgi:hypothetical protein